MTSKLTRERIELIANFHRAMTLPPSHAEIEELARMALAAMDSESVDEVYAELYRLREEVKGPDGFDTWRDAAIDEKKARVELERQRTLRRPSNITTNGIRTVHWDIVRHGNICGGEPVMG